MRTSISYATTQVAATSAVIGSGAAHPIARPRGVTLGVIAALVFGLMTLAGVAPPAASAAPPLPENDPFYTAPPGFEEAEPGTILRSRPVTVAALNLFPIRVRAWQLLYRTTDFHNQPYTSVTTVMVPDGPARPRPLLSYQTAVDAIAGMCSASYSLQQGSPIDFGNPAGPLTAGAGAAEILLAASGLARGWAVSIPDQGGTQHRFATPREPGYVVLDGIRAAEQFDPLGLDGTRTPVTLWGYSGGGIATAWTAEMQPEYAPELNIVGAAVGAPVADLFGGLKAVNGGLLGGLIPIAVAAIAKDSPEFAAAVDRYMSPEGQALVADVHGRCTSQTALNTTLRELLRHFSLPDVTRYLSVSLDELLQDPVIRTAIEERTLGRRAPSAPVYLYNNVNDEVSTAAGADALANSYCAAGTSVTSRRDQFPPVVSPHVNFAVMGAPDAFNWLAARVEGQPAQPGCDIRTVPSTLLDGAAIGTLGSSVGAALSAMLGLPLGAGR
ncbi:lipase family protein [Nocardia brasiliensis]|uniref:lipase family protein n=1 Tax=Nocardia brasiliensis TaxID=37326 RepID=UPI0024543022|nr:lipase family protein [Nocardia brasiliensis]